MIVLAASELSAARPRAGPQARPSNRVRLAVPVASFKSVPFGHADSEGMAASYDAILFMIFKLICNRIEFQ